MFYEKYSEKGFEILGIDNNSRRSFFGKDGDINWVKKKLSPIKIHISIK